MDAIKHLSVWFFFFFSGMANAQHEINVVKYDSLTQVHFREGIDTFLLILKDTFLLKDFEDYLHDAEHKVNPEKHLNKEKSHLEWWSYFLNRLHPSVSTLEKYFQLAATEFNVPVHLLYSIAMVENNWTHIGPSIDQGWGMMHLVGNNYAQTLEEASELLGISKKQLKNDPFQNIRGCAALLSNYAGPHSQNFKNYEQWYPALKKYSALIDSSTRQFQLDAYLKILYEGKNSKTIWGEKVILEPQEKVYK